MSKSNLFALAAGVVAGRAAGKPEAKVAAVELPEDIVVILERARAAGINPARVLASLGITSADG